MIPDESSHKPLIAWLRHYASSLLVFGLFIAIRAPRYKRLPTRKKPPPSLMAKTTQTPTLRSPETSR
ncbi:hypothetical protein [Marinobacterium lutimaris]|uniref:hypothetical protein n=1 Tax=Marinobacterium lutimaris TaxID=568106 RepID=UPI0011AFF07F|nr:hypothetical protein [Marinobacterium lutimaris]